MRFSVPLVAFVVIWCSSASAQPATRPAESTPAEFEQTFRELLTDADLVGRFTAGNDPASKEDRYAISSAVHLLGDAWLITAKIGETGRETFIPVPVIVKFAGDTPMIQLTDLTIPGLGTFSARVLFYRNQYAGTWQHGATTGVLYGRVEKNLQEKKP